MEIDFINDNQSKIYISYVDVNPFIKFGIRTHYNELTIAHCLHSLFDPFHRDFLLLWIFFLPSLALTWEFIALHLGISHYYQEVPNFTQTAHKVMIQCSTIMMIIWFFAKTGYYMFYAMGYKVEHNYNRWIKIANMVIIFINSIFICYALFNHSDEKQYELGYLTIFIISTLLILNVLLTLNPIQREEADDMHSRSCCSG